jgi:SAM-dependent methyltransferase
MLLSLSTLLPSLSHPTLSHSLHFLSPSSPTDFTTPLFSPIPSEPERKLIPPCREFDLAIANLVAHHVDDLDGWMEGAVGLLRKGGWLIVTEFGKEEGGKDVAGEVRTEKDKERQEGLQRVKAGANAEAGEAGEAGEVSGSQSSPVLRDARLIQPYRTLSLVPTHLPVPPSLVDALPANLALLAPTLPSFP